MEQHIATASTTGTTTSTAKTTILDIPIDCWKLILSKLDTNNQADIASLSLTCKHLLSVTNTFPFSLTLTTPLQLNLTTLLLPLLCRFSTSLHTLSIHSSVGNSADAALFFIASTDAAAHLRCIHLYDLDALPLPGLRRLGFNSDGVKVLTLSNIGGLCDQLVVAVSVDFPLIEEIDLKNNNLTDKGIFGLAQNLKYLRKINLSDNLLITDKSLVALCDCCLDLKEVEVRGCVALTQSGMGYVMRRSAELTRIIINSLDDIYKSVSEETDYLFTSEDLLAFFSNYESKLDTLYVEEEETEWLCIMDPLEEMS